MNCPACKEPLKRYEVIDRYYTKTIITEMVSCRCPKCKFVVTWYQDFELTQEYLKEWTT